MLKKILNFPFVVLIKLYQYTLSPMLGAKCRYTPTCSQYTIDAINKYGIFKGIYLGIGRICTCHPKGGSGYDPVP